MAQQSIVVSDEEELELVVMQHALTGFTVAAQSCRRTVLHRKKRFGLSGAIIYLLLSLLVGLIFVWAIGFAVYVIFYAQKSDDYIEVLLDGVDDQSDQAEPSDWS